VNRRQFLQSALSVAKKQVAEVPKQAAKIPKNTLTNIREYDKVAKTIKNKGNIELPRRSFLDKAKKRIGVLLIKNPKETAYRAKQGAKATGNTIKNTVTPLDDLVMKSEGRKMNKLQKFLSNFSSIDHRSDSRYD
jgi:hypothetical protein